MTKETEYCGKLIYMLAETTQPTPISKPHMEYSIYMGLILKIVIDYNEKFDRNEYYSIHLKENNVYCLYHHIPAGYSSYTYDPDETWTDYTDVYTLVSMGLTQEAREKIMKGEYEKE
jgi:hypothetical protein